MVSILTLNIQESVMRFALVKNYNRSALVTVSMCYAFVSSAVVALGLAAQWRLFRSIEDSVHPQYFSVDFLTGMDTVRSEGLRPGR